jgi:DNA cross-link repair 1A protein
VEGTPFVVDGFTGAARQCTPAAWILSHFHSDHYGGLGPRWPSTAPIICTPATAALVRLRLRPPPGLLLELPLGERRVIAGVAITLFDANHCPGAAMMLFEPPDAPPVLHTGDCRWDAAKMAAQLGPVLGAMAPERRAALRLVLDTTYCDPAALFPPCEEAVTFVANAVRSEAFNGRRTLFLVGSYTIGKEKVAFAAARAASSRLYAGAAKQAVLAYLPLAREDRALLTSDDTGARVHIVPMSCVTFGRMAGIARHYRARYDTVVGFAPSGWAFGRASGRAGGSRAARGSLVRYDVPYSEHSSFPELRAACLWLRPAAICPSVGNDMGPRAARMVRLLTAHPESPELRLPAAPLRKPGRR